MLPVRLGWLVVCFALGIVSVFGQAEGTVLWTYKGGDSILAAPSIGSDGTIYVAPALSEGGPTKLTALSRDGQRKWQFDEVEGRVLWAPAIAADGNIYFGTTDIPYYNVTGKFYALNPDGGKVWEFNPMIRQWPSSPRINAAPAIASDGTIYFGAYAADPSGSSARVRFFALNPDGSLEWELAPPGRYQFAPAIGEDGIIYWGTSDRLYAPQG